MKYVAAFDIGTTAVKGVLCGTDGQLASSASVDISTIFSGENAEYKEQDPQEWYRAFCQISAGFFEPASGRTAEDVIAVVMSGQMQDVIPVDQNLEPLGNAILYSDGRGEPQSERIKKALGEDYLEKSTGNHYDGSLSFPKLVWIKENEPDRYQQIHKVLISSKDYVNARLTGRACGDVTACATAGAMDIHKKVWDETIIESMGVSPELFPELLHSHQRVGNVTEQAAAETGYKAGTAVYTGVGDAGATTLASGISDLGQYNINLGTSGWVATVSDDVLPARMGVFNLAAMPEGKYINVVPFLNAGNVHKWISGLFTLDKDENEREKSERNRGDSEAAGRDRKCCHESSLDRDACCGENGSDKGKGDDGSETNEKTCDSAGREKERQSGASAIDYDYIGRLLEQSSAGSCGVMFLPYLAGERFPVMDAGVRGCFVGLSPETGKADMIRACLEGVAFSIRQGIDSIGTAPKKVSVIGGGGRVAAWCQILADVLNQTVYVYKNAEILPSLAISSAALLGEGLIQGYDEFTNSLQGESGSLAYKPISKNTALYDEIYSRYLRIYPAIKEIGRGNG